MNYMNIYKNLRYFPISTFLPKTLISSKTHFPNSNTTINLTSHPLYFSILSPGSRSVSSLHGCRCNSYHINRIFSHHSLIRLFTVSSSEISELRRLNVNGVRAKEIPKKILEITEIIKMNDDDLESNLSLMNVGLSIALVTGVFRVLNSEKVLGLRFFEWVRKSQPSVSGNVDICSLVIDNCGRLDDYEAMMFLLKDFRLKQVCLTEKAFGFVVPLFGSSKASVMDCIQRVIEVLNGVGGSCRSTGVRSLIRISCSLDFFDIAKFVIELTERSTLYYNVLILELCQKRKFNEARELLEEMKGLGCDPNPKSYNYLLSSLCKYDMISESYNVLEEMKDKGCLPDAITFEIFIFYLCNHDKFEIAFEFINQMAATGVEPRLSSHAALIKGYFRLRRYEEAYNYVVSSALKFSCSSNEVYSLLASLYQKKGDLIAAHKILLEMIDIGLKPNFTVYITVSKSLHKTGRGYLASDLKKAFTRLTLQPSIENE